jgi:predicted transcriptional regulator
MLHSIFVHNKEKIFEDDMKHPFFKFLEENEKVPKQLSESMNKMLILEIGNGFLNNKIEKMSSIKKIKNEKMDDIDEEIIENYDLNEVNFKIFEDFLLKEKSENFEDLIVKI